ncbi:MAG: ketoacyl-ACP synthase III [Chloroflexi bacterium]|nr:ketoacyl-ACP synthase III [Chloroflexota bacterium]
MRLAARITGVGAYLPERILTNIDLERMVETDDAWIVERTGIRERHIAADHETTSTMGAEAARRALATAGIEATDLDLIVTGTCTPDGLFPAAATLIQHQIGATRAGTFDVNAACTGFLSALSVATNFIVAGQAERALVVGAETLSRIVDWTDRGTCVLFGDGAGAVVVERAPDGEPGGVDAMVLRADGAQAPLLYSQGPCSATALSHEAKIIMDGRNVFRHAVTAMADASSEALRRAGLTADDLALVVPHQANLRIITAVADRLGMPMERVFVNVDRTGNTSSATIPIALAEAVAGGRLAAGDRFLLTAFGGGLTWGALVLEWAGVRVPSAVRMPTGALVASPSA